MDAKLTLKLDKEIIKLAKEYVAQQGTSLSKFIEDYLRHKIQSEQNNYKISIHPALKAMETGVDYVKLNNLKNRNLKEEKGAIYDSKLEDYLKLTEE